MSNNTAIGNTSKLYLLWCVGMELTVDWSAMEARLHRLLTVDVEGVDVLSPSVDEPHQGVGHTAWLVLNMHRVVTRGNGNTAAAMEAAWGAIMDLYKLSERMRLSWTKTEALWKRVLTSRMMVTPLSADGATVWRFAHHHVSRPVRVAIKCSTDDAFWEFLRSMFDSTREPWVRSLTVGLCFVNCGLDVTSILRIEGLLKCRSKEPLSLVATTLGLLDLSENYLSADALGALSWTIRTNCIRDIRLEKTIRNVTPEIAWCWLELLKRIFKPTNVSHWHEPINLSLARNPLWPACFKAIAELVEDQGRPLSKMKLNGTIKTGDANSECWRQIAPLFFSRRIQVSTSCEIDLSGCVMAKRSIIEFQKSLRELVHANVWHVRVALESNMRVTCKVKSAMIDPVAVDWSSTLITPFSTSVAYAVVEVRDDGWYRLVDGDWNGIWVSPLCVQDVLVDGCSLDSQPSEGALQIRQALSANVPVMCSMKKMLFGQLSLPSHEVLRPAGGYRVVGARDDGWFRVLDEEWNCGWLSSECIREMRVEDGDYLLKARFTSLVIDDFSSANKTTELLSSWLGTVAPDAKKLSLRWTTNIHASLRQILSSCEALTHLNLEGCYLSEPELLWGPLLKGMAPRLESLVVNTNFFGNRGFTSQDWIVSTFRLRHLAISRNHMSSIDLAFASEALRDNNTLEIIELDRATPGPYRDVFNWVSEVKRRHDMQLLGYAPLPLLCRLAFLSVLTTTRSMDTPVVSLVFSFAASHVTRRVLWFP